MADVVLVNMQFWRPKEGEISRVFLFFIFIFFTIIKVLNEVI